MVKLRKIITEATELVIQWHGTIKMRVNTTKIGFTEVVKHFL